jgi:integrase
MRFKSSYSLYRRKIGGGRTVFYYRCYDENGNRVCGHSTGQSTKTAAREYCNILLKEGKLIKYKYCGVPTFKDFANGFWDSEKSEYLKSLKKRKEVSASYPCTAAMMVRNHLLPKFGNLKLDAITSELVDNWLLSFPDKGLSNGTGNLAIKILSVMLTWAIKKDYINANPCKGVKHLKNEKKNRELLDHEDIQKLFGSDWNKYWNKYMYCFISKLAACTGMRISELVGLKGEYVMGNHIIVNGQHNKFGYTSTKNHKTRTIPLPHKVINELNEFKAVKGNGYLFCADGEEKPVSAKTLSAALEKALSGIGINPDEQKRRGLSFHSWRHFFNTSLLLANVPVPKVQKLTDHCSVALTEAYTHIKRSELDDITPVQEKLIAAV